MNENRKLAMLNAIKMLKVTSVPLSMICKK